MSLKGQILKGALLLSVGQMAGYILSFVRNVALARLLTQADFGIAATFFLTIALLDMASNLASDKLLIQSEDGNDERLQGVVHAFESTRGIVLGLILFALAGPFAHIFGVPEATWAYQLLALAPIIGGFRHLDVARVQRGMRYGPQVIMEVTTSIVALAAVWPLVHWIGDYSTVLWILLLRQAILTVMSHVIAERPYRWAWDSARSREVLVFGWPLVLNGLLLYAAVQGDRLIVGATFPIEELGVYSAAVFLAMTPVMPLGRLHGALALPALSQAQASPARFLRRHMASTQLMAFAGAGVMIVFVLLGDELMRLIYGAKYAGGGALLAWVGAAQAVRMVRMATNTSAMSLGDTQNLLLSNIARGVGVVGAAATAFSNCPVWTVAAAGFAGEVVAITVAGIGLRRRHEIPLKTSAGPTSGVLLFGALAWAVGIAVSGLGAFIAASALLIVLCLAGLGVSPFLREFASWTTWRRGGSGANSRTHE